MCFFHESEKQKRLLMYTALSDRFLQRRRSVFTARHDLNVCVIKVLAGLVLNLRCFSYIGKGHLSGRIQVYIQDTPCFRRLYRTPHRVFSTPSSQS